MTPRKQQLFECTLWNDKINLLVIDITDGKNRVGRLHIGWVNDIKD